MYLIGRDSARNTNDDELKIYIRVVNKYLYSTQYDIISVHYIKNKIANKLGLESLKKNLILFGLLWEKKAVRITPPLTISKKEIKKGCDIIISILNSM